MLNDFAIRIRPALWAAKRYSLLLALALAASADRLAHASTLTFVPDCSAAGDSLKCTLAGVLNFLYAAAAVLAAVLVGVVALAVKIYRKNKDDEKVGS